MVSTAPGNYKMEIGEDQDQAFRKELLNGVDVLESNFPIRKAGALQYKR